MDFFDLLKMVGGLALFLYGMNLLGDGLSQASGGRLELSLIHISEPTRHGPTSRMPSSA